MITKIKLLIIALLSAIIFLSGCSGTEGQQGGIGLPGGGGDSGSSSDSGIILDFSDIEIQPQKGFEFSMLLKVENHQRHAISDLKIKPTGFDWSYVSGLNTEYSVSMATATVNGPSYFTINMQNIVLDGFEGDYNWDPSFKYCYTAKSIFREEKCVPNSLGQCDVDVQKETFQNGPLRITLDNIYPQGDNIIAVDFTIRDTKRLQGNIVNECFQSENLNQFGNEFKLNSVMLGSSSGDCNPTSSNKYEINDGQAKFTCKFNRGSNTDAYSSQVSVELEYLYQQQHDQDITVRDLDPQFR